MNYDIIGDIHGSNLTLIQLLEKLGYNPIKGIYQQSERKVIFLEDFIDRGPGQREVIDIVRPMIEEGHALAVMGNLEFNALAYATSNSDKNEYLREHSAKNIKQHKAFLDTYVNDVDGYEDVISWFKSLPLWLDLGTIKIIHACWDKVIIAKLNSSILTDELLIKSSTKGTWEYNAIETLLKGKEIPLKTGSSFHDKDGNERHHIRVRWWDKSATTYQTAFMGP